MTYSVDVYYNANETVLAAVQNHVEEKYNVETTTYKGFLFLKSDDREVFNAVVEDLEGGEHPYSDYQDYATVAECAADVVNGVMSEAEFSEVEAQALISDSDIKQQQEVRELSDSEVISFIETKVQELREHGIPEEKIAQMFSNIECNLANNK